MSISRNPKNNRWYVLVDVPAGPDGKRRRRGVGGFKTKREAKAAEAEPSGAFGTACLWSPAGLRSAPT